MYRDAGMVKWANWQQLLLLSLSDLGPNLWIIASQADSAGHASKVMSGVEEEGQGLFAIQY